MTRKQIYIAIGCAALVFIGIRLYYAGNNKAQNVVTVTASTVISKDVTIRFQTIGTVQAYSTVDIKSMVTGPLVSAGFNEGDIVEKGQILFTIDPRPFQAALDSAKADLARDQASFANSQKIIERNTPLLKKGYIDKQSYDTLLTNAKSMAATVQADQAAVETAALNLEYATIKAPIAGKTGNITLKPGSTIKANDTLTLVTIAQINPIYVSFAVPQQYLRLIQENMHAGTVHVRAMLRKNLSEDGIVTFIDNTVNTTTGTIQIKATFENASRRLWPGEFVTVEMALENVPNAVLIPSQALMTGQKGFYVYVLDQNSIAHIRYVTPGPAVDDNTIVEQGLRPGEVIVTAGQLRLADGMQAKVK